MIMGFHYRHQLFIQNYTHNKDDKICKCGINAMHADILYDEWLQLWLFILFLGFTEFIFKFKFEANEIQRAKKIYSTAKRIE